MIKKFNEHNRINVYRYHNEFNRNSDLLRGGTFYSPKERNIKLFDKTSDEYIEGLGGDIKSVGYIDYSNPFILKCPNGWIHNAVSKWDYLKIDYKDLMTDKDLTIIEDITFMKYKEELIPYMNKLKFISNKSKKLLSNMDNDNIINYSIYDQFISFKLKEKLYDILIITDENDKITEIFDFKNLFIKI